MKVQGQSSSETPLEYSQDQMPWEPKIAYDLFIQFESYREFMQFQISSRRENRQRATWLSKIRILGKFLRRQFCFIVCRRQQVRAIK